MDNDNLRNKTTYGNVTVAQNVSGQWGVIDLNGNVIVPFGKYGWIDGFDHGLARVRTHGLTGKRIIGIIGDNGKLISDIDEINQHVSQDGAFAKWGIINDVGEEVLPTDYDAVWTFFGKNRYSTKVVKDDNEWDVYFDELKSSGVPILHRINHRYNQNYRSDNDYGTHYGEFAGSYAQDVMHISDDVINDAFEGDPDAYWNID